MTTDKIWDICRFLPALLVLFLLHPGKQQQLNLLAIAKLV
jgi:hypothetical protein